MTTNDYKLIGGITVEQIVQCFPMFDAMTPEFWIYANEYIPKNILQNSAMNKKIIGAINKNIWFRNSNEENDFQNNGLSISYEINDLSVVSLTIKQSSKILFSIKK